MRDRVGHGRVAPASDTSRRSKDRTQPEAPAPLGVREPASWRSYLDGADARGRGDVLAALGNRAGNAAVQRFVDTATPKGGEVAPSGPGKAGKARLLLSKQGKVETPIEAFSFGGFSPTDAASGKASAKTQFNAVSLTRQSDVVSPKLMSAHATNEVMTLEVDVVAPAANGKPAKTFTYTFGEARLTSLTQSGGGGSPTEQLAVAFGSWGLSTPASKTTAATGDAGTFLSSVFSPKPIRLHAVGWGATSPTDPATGQAAGKAKRQALSITKDMDSASPHLLTYMQTNKSLPSAKVALSGKASAGGGPAPAAGTFDLKNVRIESVQQSAGGDRPSETVRLSFQSYDYATTSGGGVAPNAAAVLDVHGVKSGKWKPAAALSWTWGASTPTDKATGQATAKRQLHVFEITVPAGPATVHFLNALSTNETLKTVNLNPKTGPAYALANARVTSLQIGADDNQQPTTTIKLAYQTVAQQAGKNTTQDSWTSTI